MDSIKIIGFIVVLAALAFLSFAFQHTSLQAERDLIIRNHCDVLDVDTGTFKCANGKVYKLGAE